VGLLLPNTARAWAAIAVIVAIVAAVSFAISDAAGITALAVAAAITVLNVGRVARWIESTRVNGAALARRQEKEAAFLRARLETLSGELDAARRDLAGLVDQMSSLRLTVSQAASAIAQQRHETG
jgi:hypothetical protein